MDIEKHKHIKGITVNQQISINQKSFPGATGEFSLLLQEIIVAAKVIRDKITLAGIAEVLGYSGEQNIQGETVAILDEIANKCMVRRLLGTGLVCMVITEEEKDPQYPTEDKLGGNYVVAVDPCDGSSNISCNVPVGTIFAIWKRVSPRDQPPTDEDALQLGRDMVCGGYVLYGPSSMFVYSTGDGVHGFTYDPSIGEFILTHPNMSFPVKPYCYSVNESYTNFWDEKVKNFVGWLKDPNVKGHPINARYVGSLVSDFHRNLLYGGIFLYPMDKRSNSGKLRLLYECAPLSFIAEHAGGKGSTGDINILDIKPSNIHQRIPLFIGIKSYVEIAEEFLNGTRTNENQTNN
jgi:fructose-1,6-bisphosphatase I